MGNGESVHVQRHLTADDDGRGMGPTPTTTYDGWDDPSTAGQGIVADTEEEGTYTHIGCFSDSKEDRVLGHMLWADDMTAKVYILLSDIFFRMKSALPPIHITAVLLIILS